MSSVVFCASASRTAPGPRSRARKFDDRGSVRGVCARDSGGGGEMRGRAAFVDQVDERKRDAARKTFERRRCDAAFVLGTLRVGAVRGEIAEQQDAALADDLFRRLLDRAEDAADAVARIGVGQRTVRPREVRFADEAMPVDVEQNVLVPRRRAAVLDREQLRSDRVPDLAPAVARCLAQSDGMFAAHDRKVGVVVELDEVRPPPEHHREAAGQHDVEDRPQFQRPGFRGTERCARPIRCGHERGHDWRNESAALVEIHRAAAGIS